MKLISAKEASKLSAHNKKRKLDERKSLKELPLEEQVIHQVNEAISEGKTMKSFSSRTEVGRWIRDNKEELKDLGYELSFFMGKSTAGDVRVDWRKY